MRLINSLSIAALFAISWPILAFADLDDPFDALENVDKGDPPYKDKEIQKWLRQAWEYEAGPGPAAGVILRKADFFRRKSYGPAQIKKAAMCLSKEQASLALQYLDAYRNQPYAKEVVRKSIESDVWSALKYDSIFLDVPGSDKWLKDAVMKAVKTSPGKLLSQNAQLNNLPYGAQILIEAAQGSVVQDPGEFLYFAKSHPTNSAVTDEAIEKAVRGAIGRSPWATSAVLQNVSLYRKKPFRSEVVEKAVRYKVKYEPRMAVYEADAFVDEPFAAGILNELVDSCKGEIFGGVQFFKNKLYAPHIVAKAAALAPWSALKYADKYSDQPYAAETIKSAASKNPEAVLSEREKIKGLSFGKDLIQDAESLLIRSNKVEDKCFIWMHPGYFQDLENVRKALQNVDGKECLALSEKREE